MKVTGTKKLLIVLFALACVVTLGLGAFFGGWFFKSAPSVYAEEEKVTLPDFANERLQKISEKTGIGVEALRFYVKSDGGSESELCDYYDLVGEKIFVDTVTKFLSEYSSGEIETDNDFSNEDWYLSPDQAGTYASYIAAGQQTTITAFYSTKSMMTTEQQYFRNTGFMMGPYTKRVYSADNSVNDRNSMEWHENMYYNFAWVEEGEELYFGVNSTKGMYEQTYSAIDTNTWMNGPTAITQSYANWCTTPAAQAAGYTYGAPTFTGISGTAFDPTTGEMYYDPDPTRNTKAQWVDEFGSAINPAQAYMNGGMRVKGTSAATSGGSGYSGQLGIWLSADAPSGTYYFTLGKIGNSWNNRFYGWDNADSSTGRWGYENDFHVSWLNGMENWRYRMGYAVSICRTGITTPKLKYNDGVDTQLKNKEVDYNGGYHELIIENDWGPGLITYNVSKYDETTGQWVDYANNTDIPGSLDCTQRSAAGAGKQGDTIFRAKDAGKYKIKMTPYRNWETADKQDPVEFTFTINPKKLETPTILGDDGNTGYKFLNATGRTLFITIYPVPNNGDVTYSAPSITNSLGTFSLTQDTWDDAGVLTLGGMGQGTYTITISINDPVNVAWDTAVPPGDPPDTADKVFTFEIGPMKITVPDIVDGGGGGSSQFKKEVVYNGALQSMSFMPVDTSQLIIDAVNVDNPGETLDIDTSKDKTVTINAQDAGHYKVTIKVKPEYIFEEMSTELTYELIIHEAEIEAPYLCAEDAAVAVNNVKTVTYGGEKIAGTSEDWVATLSFDNADEARIDWVSTSNIASTGWSDSRLTLAAKAASTYVVTFQPKKNYKWKDGVVVPDYTLIIERLKIARPVLYNDGEEGAEYTSTSKSIGFDDALHSIYFDFPTLAESSAVDYIKSASVYTLHEGNFETTWDGDRLAKTGKEAGTFKITITPTLNYCWSDGSSDPMFFTFIIVPVDVNCLDMWTTDEFGSRLMEITNKEYSVNLHYDGDPKTVRIGNPDATTDKERYLTSGNYAMSFNLLDKDGNFIDPYPEMTVDETGGFLTVTMINAGVYKIGVSLVNTNYWWTESKSSMMVYTLTINAEGINAPKIDETKSAGNNTEGNFGADIMRGTYSEISDTHKYFMLVAQLDDEKYSEFVKITDPNGVVYDYATFAAMKDSDIAAMRNEELAKDYGVFTTWLNKNICLYAFDQGEYKWTFELTSDNYKWAGTEERTLTYTILVKRSPVSGLEMRYVGDADEAGLNGDEGILVSDTNIRGDEYNSDKTVYAKPVFSEDWKGVRFIQSSVGDIFKAGFSTQFEYEIRKKAANGDYTEEIIEPHEDVYSFDELKLSFFDAGEYEIHIRPKDNYCWNNDPDSISRSYVVFKLNISTLMIERPVVKDATVDGVKETLYNHNFQLFQLELKDYPNGYAILPDGDTKYFKYINDDLAERIANGDEPVVHYEGASEADGATNLGVDEDTSLLSVEARSAGEYNLRIVVSNINNYKFSTGDSNTYYNYRFIIKKISVAIPDAYLAGATLSSNGDVGTDNVDDMTILPTESTVIADASDPDSTPINYSSQYKGQKEYCGRYYAVYLYGTAVSLGSFKIEATADLTTGDASHEVQPDEPTVPGDDTTKPGYYRLAVREVSVYTITLKFVTADYYWGNDYVSGSASRNYEFTVFKKQLDIPEITSYENTPLISDSLTVEKPYAKQPESIMIENIPFGELISTSPDVYSFINLVYDNTKVSIDAFTVGADGKATIKMSTVGDEALVTETYCLELVINSNNAEWKSGTADGSKKYIIKITKAKLERPVLTDSAGNTLKTGDTVTKKYTADVFAEALRIKNMDPSATDPLITFTLSDTDLMSAIFDTATGFENNLIVSTKKSAIDGSTATGANVGTYEVVVKIADSDNYEWSTGDIADIVFTFVIEPIEIAKPYIFLGSSTAAALGVAGNTRTVTYEWVPSLNKATQYYLNIGNYWNNVADTSAKVVNAQYPVGVIPSVMSYAIANGTPDSPLTYSTTPDGFTVNGSNQYGSMLYNEFNNGILQLAATNAGKYIVRFTLTDNAVWADGTNADVDIILQIKKLAHEDPLIIVNSAADTVDQNNRIASYTYGLDAGGNSIERIFEIDNFNIDTGIYTYDYMKYDASLTTGKVSPADGTGYLDGDDTDAAGSATYNQYTFKATNAGVYVVTFTILDPANHCWKFADVSSVSFTFEIKKYALANPKIVSDYLLSNESVDGTEFSVDFDKREHTILVNSLFDIIYDPAQSYDVNNATGLGSKYFTVENYTDNVNGAGYTTSHPNQTDNYDSTSGLKVEDLFDKITPLPTDYYPYNGDKVGTSVSLLNLFTLTAYTPGEYYLRFYLTDGDNMTWTDTSNVLFDTVANKYYIDYKLSINKVKHDAPILATGTSNNLEYDGGDVYFTIQNAYNGIKELGGSVVSTVSEQFKVVSFTAPDGTVTPSTGFNPASYIESWYDGNLVLKMRAVGTYIVEVSITDTDYISWNGTTDTDKQFTLIVSKRNLVPEVELYSADSELNAKFEGGATTWPMGTKVIPAITMQGLRKVPGASVDDNVTFEVYYAKVSDPATKLGSYTFTTGDWTITPNNDNTYNALFDYGGIAFGRGNIDRGNYILNIVIVDPSNVYNYDLSPAFTMTFTIEADPAPFKDNMLEWVYSVSTDPPGTFNAVGPFGADASSAFHLPYIDGVSYTFHLRVKSDYLNGYTDDPGPFAYDTDVQRALNSWKVDWDGNYGGTRSPSGAGADSVTVTLTAKDPDQWAFDTKVYEFHYVIDPALYDISSLTWNYDGTTPFEYDGTAKGVEITGTFPAGLTIDYYETSCTYVSDRISQMGGPVLGLEGVSNGNQRTDAGVYTTTVFFKVPPVSNYVCPENPDINSDQTYIDANGNFVWVRTWEIKPQKIVVDWTQSGTSSSDGDTVRRDPSTVAGSHASKFDYYIEKEDPAGSGNWVFHGMGGTSLTRVPGQTVTYRVTAFLKFASTDFARNYVAEFVGKDNPCLMEVGGDDTTIVNHITVNGKRDSDYEYTGDPVTAEAIIDFDTSNGAVTESDITILFVNLATPTVTSPVAPSEIGSYKVVLKLSFTGTAETYALSEPEYSFNIVKAKFHPDDLEWHVRHTTEDGTVEAKFNPSIGNKWVNVNSNEELEIIYDGFAYEIFLVSSNENLTFTMVNGSQIDANPWDDTPALIKYVSTATAVFDGDHYEFAALEFTGTLFEYDTTLTNVMIDFEWEIEKQFLDLSRVNWGYEKPFEFTVVNGIPKAFKVELINLPEYLKDKVDYTVNRLDELITGDVTNEGTYKTTAAIRTSDISANYELGAWPASVNTYVEWVVNPKRLEVPQNDLSWSEFDGTQHNLLKPFGLDVDWAEYFDISVTYEDADGNNSVYDGTAAYGGKYYAFNAGIYKFTFAIKKDFNVTINSKQMMNIVWAVSADLGYDTDSDQTVSVTVAKRELKVTGWFNDYENSYVITAGNIDVSRFIDYKFYTGASGSAGAEVTLDRVLDSAGNETFSMVPAVRKAYEGNITLAFEPGTQYTTFVTKEISEKDAQLVDKGKPFIYGYSVDGKFTQYTNEEISKGDIFVTYMGKNVTFRIYDWDYYKQYVEIWNGDDLTQLEAGKYSLTLVLRKDLDKPLYWGKKADGTIDRSSVTLTFEIRYNMLTIPDFPTEITYTGKEINVLDLAANATLKELTAQYGDYVEIVGNTATNVGEQTLYLKIKDEYGVAVRWDNGTEQGLLGTYSIGWKILPVLIQRPEVNTDARIVYDGEAHSVYELLKGYDKTNPSTAIATLMANVNETDARSVNAGGPFHAILSLPDENFAWCDASGNKLDDRSAWTHDWYIEKQTIDFNDAYWGYMDGETPVAYDPDKPFVYTLVNGAAKTYSVEILGLPEIIKLYAKYTTNGNPGNSASAVNSAYTTRVEIDLSKIDTKNYTIVTGSYESISELVWSIVPREFDLPEYDESWQVFDAKVHDLVAMLGLGEDWAEYFDIKVEYKVNEGDTYAAYKGDNMVVVGYSLYKGFNYGYYRLTVTLKNNGSLMEPGVNLKWKDGASNPEAFEIIVSKRTVTVVGWNESDEYSEVLLKDGEVLPQEIADRLEYIIYEDGNEDVLLSREDVATSTGDRFCIDYRFKQGTDANGIAYSYGIDLEFETGVARPYEFGTRDYGSQPIIWVPTPILEKAVLEYNGEQQTFKIKDFDTLYRLSDAERISLNYTHGLSLDASVKSLVYLQVANSLTRTAAGEYSAVVRLLGPVKLSWYDPALYKASADRKTLYEADGVTPVSDPNSLFNEKSITLNFKVKKKVVPLLSDEDLEILKGMIVTYDGTEKDVVEEKADLFKILEDKYGKIFKYSGNTGTAADSYTLEITLKDPDSCIWYDGEPEQVEVSEKGYELRYVKDGDGWKVVYVKTNENGPETDASGNYIEYNDGDYTVDVKYLPEFEIELLDASAYTPNIIDLTTGQLNIEYVYLYDSDDNIVTVNGKQVKYDYVMNGANIARFDASGNPDPSGTYIKRIRLDLTDGDKEYGYKVTVKEFVEEYTYLFSKLSTDAFTGDPVPALDKDGNPIAFYLYHNGGSNYELRKYQLDGNGKFISNGSGGYLYTVEENHCDMVDAKTYNLIGGTYVEEVGGTGEYMLRYVQNGSGNKVQKVVYAKDENGNFIIDVEHSVIKENKYNEVKDKKFEVEWKIDSSILSMPEFDISLMQQYTGKTLYAKDVLKGFLPDLMKIVEGGEAVDAGEYTAKIVLTTDNSKWDPADTTENYVLVNWRIDTAKVDMSKISWFYTDGTDMYTDSSSFVYTRKDGKEVIFWVGIANLPEVMKDKVVFTTNKTPGAYAGIYAGNYNTSVKFIEDKNIDAYTIPETFEQSINWSIKRRMLSVPDANAVQLVFDSEAHDLLEMLGVPADWNEYYDINVMYSNGGEFVKYEGYEGNPYIAYGFGSYKFTFAIKSGINTSLTNPNVVWIKSSGETEVPSMLNPEDEGGYSAEDEEEIPVKKTVRKPVVTEEEVLETVENIEVENTEIRQPTVQTVTVVTASERAIRQVCDRLKQLSYGAEINLQSFRKYSMRGTI